MIAIDWTSVTSSGDSPLSSNSQPRVLQLAEHRRRIEASLRRQRTAGGDPALRHQPHRGGGRRSGRDDPAAQAPSLVGRSDGTHPHDPLSCAGGDDVDREGAARLRHRLGRRPPDLVGLGAGQLPQALEGGRGEREPEAALAAAEALTEGEQLGVQRVDGPPCADRLAEVDLAAVGERLDLDRLAVAEDDRGEGELVEEGLERVGNGEAGRRVEVPAGSDHVYAVGRAAELGNRASRHQVRLARARPDAEHCEQPGLLELAVQLELLRGDVVEAAEVEVVRPGPQAGPLRVKVDAIARRVDQGVDVGEQLVEALAGVRLRGARLAATLGRGDGRRLLAVEVQQQDRADLIRLGEVAHDRRRDRASGSQDRNVHATSSLARRASQNSIRSWARDRSRPVSSSTLRIR